MEKNTTTYVADKNNNIMGILNRIENYGTYGPNGGGDWYIVINDNGFETGYYSTHYHLVEK